MERPFAPAAERNRQPILEVLRERLPRDATVLEIASGTGQHVRYFAEALPDLTWIPSEKDAQALATLGQGLAGLELRNVAEPLIVDVGDLWPDLEVDAVIVANLLHISAPETAQQLCQGAASVCRTGGLLHVYGPFKVAGTHTSHGNAAFDASLRRQNPAWGIRDVEQIIEVAADSGFTALEQIAMPANNLSLVFARQ